MKRGARSLVTSGMDEPVAEIVQCGEPTSLCEIQTRLTLVGPSYGAAPAGGFSRSRVRNGGYTSLRGSSTVQS